MRGPYDGLDRRLANILADQSVARLGRRLSPLRLLGTAQVHAFACAWFAVATPHKTTPDIEGMAWEEKLRTLEKLRDSITRKGDRYESPAWHKQALK